MYDPSSSRHGDYVDCMMMKINYPNHYVLNEED